MDTRQGSLDKEQQTSLRFVAFPMCYANAFFHKAMSQQTVDK